MSLSIGLNALDPEHYYGQNGELKGCENDAWSMLSIARSRGFSSSTILLTGEATRWAVSDHIKFAASRLVSGDIFMLSYAGHGGQIEDVNGDEADKKDETWCLYDGQLLGDELDLLLSNFMEGVRVVIISDSCHSGTVLRAEVKGVRCLSSRAAKSVYERNRDFYDGITNNPELKDAAKSVAASVLLLAACRDHESAHQDDDHGFFTSTLLKLWDGGACKDDYARLSERIDKAMQDEYHFPPFDQQHPCLSKSGRPDLAFEQQAALKI